MEWDDACSEEYLLSLYISPPSPPGYFPWTTSEDSFYVYNKNIILDQHLGIALREMLKSQVFVEMTKVSKWVESILMDAQHTDPNVPKHGDSNPNLQVQISSIASVNSGQLLQPVKQRRKIGYLQYGKSQQTFQGQMDTINLETEHQNAPCDSRNCDSVVNNLQLSLRNRDPQGVSMTGFSWEKYQPSLPKISTVLIAVNQILGPHFNGTKNPFCQSTVLTSQIQEKEIMLTADTSNITAQSYIPRSIGADIGSQYNTRNGLINHMTISVTEPMDAQFYRLMTCYLYEGQPSITPRTFEREAIDLGYILEDVPQVDQHTQHCDDSSNFVNEEGYHHGFEMGPNGTSLASDVEIDGKGKKEIPLEDILKLQSTGITLEDAAKELGASRSTLKRRCRDYGISNWRSNKGMVQDHSNQNHPNTISFSISESSQLNLENPDNSGDISFKRQRKNASEFKSRPSSTSKIMSAQEITLDNTGGGEENTEPQQAPPSGPSRAIQDGTSTVFTVKAKYKDDIIKFNFLATSSFDQLKEDVGSRLNLDSSKFKITYIDEDEDTILIPCDTDLQSFLKNMEQSKTTLVRLYITDKS